MKARFADGKERKDTMAIFPVHARPTSAVIDTPAFEAAQTIISAACESLRRHGVSSCVLYLLRSDDHLKAIAHEGLRFPEAIYGWIQPRSAAASKMLALGRSDADDWFATGRMHELEGQTDERFRATIEANRDFGDFVTREGVKASVLIRVRSDEVPDSQFALWVNFARPKRTFTKPSQGPAWQSQDVARRPPSRNRVLGTWVITRNTRP